MSHFGFICPPYLGHLNPMSAVAAELRRRGHATTVLGISDVAGSVGGAGFVQLGAGRYPTGSLARLKAHMAAPRGLGLFRVIQDMSGMTDMLCREAPAAVRAAGIDALVSDQLEAAGGLVAAHLGLPLVSVANALPINREPAVPPPFTDWAFDSSTWGLQRNAGGHRVADAMMAGLNRVISAWAAEWRLPPWRRVDECLSATAQITQLVPGFDFPRNRLPSTVRHCGPLRGAEGSTDLAPLTGEGTRPLVFASLGTLQGGRIDLFRRIAAASARLGLRLVIAHGGALTDRQIASLPGEPVVRSFVPQRALLAKAALAVTNGGLNTVLDALAAGVPVVTIPIAFEQGAIAARLERCGGGIKVPLRRASVDRLAAAMDTALSQPRFRDAAGTISAEIAAGGGVRLAADVVEATVRREPGSSPTRAAAIEAA